MAYYFIAGIKINNPAEYEKYLENIDEIFLKYKGEYLVVDSGPEVLEGTWNYSKSVVIKFNSRQDFRDWYYSADYQEILRYRLAAATCDTILAEGIN